MRKSQQSDIKELAEIMLTFLTTGKRDNGETFVKQKDDAPDWVNDVCREAHGDLLPDDYRYAFIQDALEAIVNSDDLDDIEIDADTYTSDLIDWLGSRNSRYSYVDDAIENFGKSDTIIDDIRSGQLVEKREVLDAIINELSSLDLDDIKEELAS
jgi:hypothetical protein